MKLQAVQKKIVVEIQKVEKEYGGITVPENASQDGTPLIAEVVSIGEKVEIKDLKEGSKVLIHPYAGQKMEDETIKIISELSLKKRP